MHTEQKISLILVKAGTLIFPQWAHNDALWFFLELVETKPELKQEQWTTKLDKTWLQMSANTVQSVCDEQAVVRFLVSHSNCDMIPVVVSVSFIVSLLQ